MSADTPAVPRPLEAEGRRVVGDDAGSALRQRGKSLFHVVQGEDDGCDHDEAVKTAPSRPGGRRASLQFGAVKVRRRSLLASASSRGSPQHAAPRGRRTSLQYGSRGATTTAAACAAREPPPDDAGRDRDDARNAAVHVPASHGPGGAAPAFDEAHEFASLVQRLSPKHFADKSTELTHTQRMTRAWRAEIVRGREAEEVLWLYERILDGVLPSLLCDHVRAQRSRFFALPQWARPFARRTRGRLAVSWGLLLAFVSENSELVAYLAISSAALAIFAS